MWSPTATRVSASWPGLFADGDQREVGGAAADVADQHDVADLDLLAPAVAAGVDPGVERGLRLLEQRDVSSPAARAASTVSSRATASNDAGTVSTMSCCSSRFSGRVLGDALRSTPRRDV